MSSDAGFVSERRLDVLLEAGVLTRAAGADGFETTAAFEQSLAETLDEETATTAELQMPNSELVAQLNDERLVARVETLAEFLAAAFPEDDVAETLVQLSFVLDQFAPDAPRSSGAPAGFLPLRADWIDSVARTYPAAVVYAWRDDCPPCDDVRETLESIAEEWAGAVGLFAVYGPSRARMLQTRYDVVGAPTTLFLCNGQVDSRIQGARNPEVFRSEVETIRERAVSRADTE